MNILTEDQKQKYNLPLCNIYYDMDGFVYQQINPSEVSDLIAMGKEVYELYDDDTESLVSDEFIDLRNRYGIEVGHLSDLAKKALFNDINQGLGLSQVQVSWESQQTAFRWYENIGDPLSHFAHFASFLSEAQRQTALNMVDRHARTTEQETDYSQSSIPVYKEELKELRFNIVNAPQSHKTTTLIKTN